MKCFSGQLAYLLSAQGLSMLGDSLSLMALLSILAFRTGGSATAVAGILGAATAPVLLVSPIAGVFVDRWDLKRAMIASDLIRATIVATLAFAWNLPQFYGLFFALHLVSVFFLPARIAALPLVVRPGELLGANALSAQVTQVTRVVSPAIAGALVGWYGERLCFFLDAVTFLGSAVLLSALSLKREPVPHTSGVASVLEDLRSGARFVINTIRIRFVVIAICLSSLALGGVEALAPVYVRDVLRGEPRELGFLMSSVAAGTLVGALLVAKLSRRFGTVLSIRGGLAGLGLGVALWAATDLAAVAVGIGLSIGVLVAFVLVPAQTILQEETPQALLGRVSGISNFAGTGALLVSIAAAGLLADQIGLRMLYASAGCSLLFVSLAALRAPPGIGLNREGCMS